MPKRMKKRAATPGRARSRSRSVGFKGVPPRKAQRIRSQSRDGRELKKADHPKEVRTATAMVAKVLEHKLYPLAKMMMDKKSDSKDMVVVHSPKDEKMDPTIELLISQLETARGMVRGILGNRPITIMLYERYTVAGTANAAYNTVKTLVPGNSTQFATFAAVFDEYKCTEMKTTIKAVPTVNGTQTGLAMWVVAYDWGVAGALGSIPSAFTQPNKVFGDINFASAQVTISTTASGFHHLNAKIPAGPMADVGIITDLMSGIWVPTSDAGAIVGYLKPYVEATGTLGVVALNGVIGYVTEFRCRG